MSETVSQTPNKQDLPKWDRSPQGVSRAIGRIASKLIQRAERLGNRNVGHTSRMTYESDPGDRLRTLGPSEQIQVKNFKNLDDFDYDDTQKKSLKKDHRYTGDWHTLTINKKGAEVSVTANDKVVQGEFNGKVINDPVAVGRVSANILNQIRSDVAKAEIEHEKSQKRAKSAISFINK